VNYSFFQKRNTF